MASEYWATIHQQAAAEVAAIARNCASVWDRSDDRLWVPALTEEDRARTLRIAVRDQEEAAIRYAQARQAAGVDCYGAGFAFARARMYASDAECRAEADRNGLDRDAFVAGFCGAWERFGADE